LTQTKAKIFKNLITTLVFEKNAIFFHRKLQKFVIITSTQGRACKICGLGLLGPGLVCRLLGPGLVCRLRVWTVGLAQKPRPRGLGLLVHVVKARGPTPLPSPTRVYLMDLFRPEVDFIKLRPKKYVLRFGRNRSIKWSRFSDFEL
jgi:hypothetical protein